MRITRDIANFFFGGDRTLQPGLLSPPDNQSLIVAQNKLILLNQQAILLNQKTIISILTLTARGEAFGVPLADNSKAAVLPPEKD